MQSMYIPFSLTLINPTYFLDRAQKGNHYVEIFRIRENFAA